MKRHLRWVIPLICIPATYFGFVLLGPAVGNGGEGLGFSLAGLLILLLAIIMPIVSLIFTIRGAMKTYRRWRESKGHFTKAVLASRARDAYFQSSWVRARELRDRLIARDVPEQIKVWEIVPNQGEMMLVDGYAEYARYYGRDVQYNRSSGIYFGHPAFVVAGVAASALGNATRQRNARNEATPQWREWQQSRVVATNQRLICHVNGQWLSFYYSSITALYPQVDKWTLVCNFEASEPLLLSGADAPTLAVISVLMSYGPDAVAEHPELSKLG